MVQHFLLKSTQIWQRFIPPIKLPDLRGEFIRGWDDGRGVDALGSNIIKQPSNIYGQFNDCKY